MSRVSARDVLPVVDPDAAGPTIAVLVSLNLPAPSEAVAELMHALTSSALRSLVDAGGVPHLVDLTGASLPELDEVAGCDGVLLLGGGDIDPDLYGLARPVPNEYGVDRTADEFSIAVTQRALADDQPLLGVCRGVQVLNVACGGTLIPDIEEPLLHHGPSDDQLFIDEHVRIDPVSRLRTVVGVDELIVRNGHHQAVHTVGDELRAVAWADDGLVEGVEHVEKWAVGVQWHPEEPAGSPADRERIFGGLVVAADEYRR
jgi:putative glutamine amidotransferase